MLERVAAASTAFHRRWLELLREQPGNPCGVDILTFADGRIVGTVAVEEPEVEWMQHVAGLDAGDDEAIFELATWYAELGAWPRYEIPSAAEDDLLHTLLAVEAKPTGALAVLAAPLAALTTDSTATSVAVRRVAPGSDDARALAAALLAGHDADDARPAHHRAAELWADEDGWQCFVGVVDGRVVGAAALVVADGMGYLANAATVPEARDGGVHSALLAARLTAARESGCDAVGAVAEPDGASARNLVRAGLAVVGARTYWTSTA